MKFHNKLNAWFGLSTCNTSVKKEFIAGLTSFITISYIIIVNPSILADAGIPYYGALLATIFTAMLSSFVMGVWGNSPIILAPGMGVNAFFTYTIVQSMGLTWQQGLGVVVTSGILFVIISSTKIKTWIIKAVPQSLKESITVGIGLFLTFIGLQKGHLIEPNQSTFVELGDIQQPEVILTLIGILLTFVLFVKKIKGSFLISIVVLTLIGNLLNLTNHSQNGLKTESLLPSLFMASDYSGLFSLSFLVAVFSLTLILVFENTGLLHSMLPDQKKFDRSFQANSFATIISGMFGTSPTISTVESAAGITEGGRTGLTAIFCGILFGLSLLFIPFLGYIPNSAIAPILIIIGGLMVQNVKNIPLDDLTEGLPAFLIIAFIPLTYSIVDGIAFGFIAFPLLKLAVGKSKQIPKPMYIVSCLFIVNFIVQAVI